MKNPLLVSKAQPGKEGEDARIPQIPAFQLFRHFTYFTLSGEEDEHVPAVVQGIQPVHGARHMGGELFIITQRRQVMKVHRIGTAFHLDDGGAPEELGKSSGIQRSGADDQPQILPPVQQKFQVAQQKVDVEAAFMGFIQNQGMILAQVRIMLRFCQQNAVRHELQARVRPGFFLKAHLVAHQAAQFAIQFFRHTAGNGSRGQPSGLGAPYRAPHLPGKLHGHFGKLGGLAGPGFTHHHNDLMLPHRRQNVVPAAGNGEVRISDVHDGGRKKPCKNVLQG